MLSRETIMAIGYQGDSQTVKNVRRPAFTNISSEWGGVLRLSLLKDSGLDILQYPWVFLYLLLVPCIDLEEKAIWGSLLSWPIYLHPCPFPSTGITMKIPVWIMLEHSAVTNLTWNHLFSINCLGSLGRCLISTNYLERSQRSMWNQNPKDREMWNTQWNEGL